jgi:hypothetical protein
MVSPIERVFESHPRHLFCHFFERVLRVVPDCRQRCVDMPSGTDRERLEKYVEMAQLAHDFVEGPLLFVRWFARP